jgi:hypothetical protein
MIIDTFGHCVLEMLVLHQSINPQLFNKERIFVFVYKIRGRNIVREREMKRRRERRKR